MGASESKSLGSQCSYGSWGAEEDADVESLSPYSYGSWGAEEDADVESLSPYSYGSWGAEDDAVSVESLGLPYSYGCWETDEDAHSEEPRMKIQEEDRDDTLMIAAVLVGGVAIVGFVGWGIYSLFFSAASPSSSSDDDERKLMKAPKSDPSAHFKSPKHF